MLVKCENMDISVKTQKSTTMSYNVQNLSFWVSEQNIYVRDTFWWYWVLGIVWSTFSQLMLNKTNFQKKKQFLNYDVKLPQYPFFSYFFVLIWTFNTNSIHKCWPNVDQNSITSHKVNELPAITISHKCRKTLQYTCIRIL